MAEIRKRLDYGRMGVSILTALLAVYAGLTMNWLALIGFVALFYYVVEYYHALNAVSILRFNLHQADEFIESMLEDDKGDDDVGTKE